MATWLAARRKERGARSLETRGGRSPKMATSRRSQSRTVGAPVVRQSHPESTGVERIRAERLLLNHSFFAQPCGVARAFCKLEVTGSIPVRSIGEGPANAGLSFPSR